MRKISVILFTILACCVLLSGCGKDSEKESLVVYSFCGENANFTISNGVIVLSSTEEIFYGGNLDGELSDVVGYSMTLYIPFDNHERILLSNSVEDMTGGTISIAGEIGKASGDILTAAEIEELQNNLFFRLKTTNLKGEENEYQLQLALTEITRQLDN